jgi:hypothetical protein
MHRKEDRAKALFTDPKAPKKPICNQRICQEAPAKCINRKQGGEFCNDSLTLGGNLRSAWREPARVSNFDCWGKKKI